MKFFSSLLARLTGRQKLVRREKRVIVGRQFTMDYDNMAFTFRMGAGFAGDVNRTHPAAIEACLIDSSFPPLLYGLAVIADAASPNGVRSIKTTDSSATEIYGVTVRPYPLQAAFGDTAYGAVTFGADQAPPTVQPLDVLKQGYIMVQLQGATAATKGGAVFVGTAATSGSGSTLLTQGGFTAVTETNAIALSSRSYWNGPADPNGIAELALHVG